MSKHFSINVVAPWKRKNIGVLAEWNANYATFSNGTDRYQWKQWKKRTIDEAADALDVCPRHCQYNIKPSTTNTWSLLTTMVATIGNPVKDEQRIKLDDTNCSQCKIGDYRKPKPTKVKKSKKNSNTNKKRTYEEQYDYDNDSESEVRDSEPGPKRKKNKKNNRYKETFMDDNDTNSDEFDISKSRPAKINANVWMACLNSMREKHGDKITAPGLVAFAQLLNGNDGDCYDPLKIPDCILKKYAIKRTSKDVYKPFASHSNYSKHLHGYSHQPPHPYSYGVAPQSHLYPPPPPHSYPQQRYYTYPPPPPPQHQPHNNHSNTNTNTHSNCNDSPTFTEIENDINDAIDIFPPPKSNVHRDDDINDITPLAIQKK
eukprot:482482_1